MAFQFTFSGDRHGEVCIRDWGTPRCWSPTHGAFSDYEQRLSLTAYNDGPSDLLAKEEWRKEFARQALLFWTKHTCPKCGSLNACICATGVDSQGEWQSCECDDCHHTWVMWGA